MQIRCVGFELGATTHRTIDFAAVGAEAETDTETNCSVDRLLGIRITNMNMGKLIEVHAFAYA